jgi:hypothetical protein
MTSEEQKRKKDKDREKRIKEAGGLGRASEADMIREMALVQNSTLCSFSFFPWLTFKFSIKYCSI